jgi:hypothetical protein
MSRNNNESHRRGIGGQRIRPISDIISDTPPQDNKCLACGERIPDPWYRPDNICFDCKRKKFEENKLP